MTGPAYDPHADDPTETPRRRGGRAPRNGANVAEQRAADAEAAREEARRRADLAALLVQPAFRRFAWRLLDRTGLHAVPKVLNAEKYWLEGAREIGVELMHEMMDVNPTALFTILSVGLHEEQD